MSCCSRVSGMANSGASANTDLFRALANSSLRWCMTEAGPCAEPGMLAVFEGRVQVLFYKDQRSRLLERGSTDLEAPVTGRVMGYHAVRSSDFREVGKKDDGGVITITKCLARYPVIPLQQRK